MSQALLIEQGYYYRDAFNVFRAHADDLFAVTVWGLTDGRSWRVGQRRAARSSTTRCRPSPPTTARSAARTCRPGCARRTCSPATCRWTRPRPRRWSGPSCRCTRSRTWPASSCAGRRTTSRRTSRSTTATSRRPTRSTFDARRRHVRRRPRRIGHRRGDGRGLRRATAGTRVVAHLPLHRRGAGRHARPRRAGDRRCDHAGWNTPGATGTLTLVEELSYLEVVEAADGTGDRRRRSTPPGPTPTRSTHRQGDLRHRRRDRHGPHALAGPDALRAGRGGRPGGGRLRLRPVDPGLGRDLCGRRATSRTAPTGSTTPRSGSTPTTPCRSARATRRSRPAACVSAARADHDRVHRRGVDQPARVRRPRHVPRPGLPGQRRDRRRAHRDPQLGRPDRRGLPDHRPLGCPAAGRGGRPRRRPPR